MTEYILQEIKKTKQILYENLEMISDIRETIENDEEEYHNIRSSTNGDYGPSNPWNAPGMSVKDFI